MNDALKTLSLKLDEVGHIRSVLAKAQLDGLPLDGNVRDYVERGKVILHATFWHYLHNHFYYVDVLDNAIILFIQMCFVCLKTRFGLFSRGQKCEM